MPRILYIGQAPNQGTGSPTILLRHLSRLSTEGWTVDVVPEWGDDIHAIQELGWHVHSLIHRQRWWPPLPIKFETTRRIAVYLWARWLAKNINPAPDAILCYLAWHTDLYCEIASQLGRLTGIPVTCLIHDDAVDFEQNKGRERILRKRQARILRHNHRNWFVSEAQALEMAPKNASMEVLPPIPEGTSSKVTRWRDSFRNRPSLYYAGYLWPAQARLLRSLAPRLQAAGAELVIMGKLTPEIRELVEKGMARHQPFFPTNREALSHLEESAAGLIVSYTHEIAELPWTRTSMPSKLIEYAFLGIPIAVIAPEGTSIMQWARSKMIKSAFNPSEHAQIQEWTSLLKNPESWHLLASEWKTFADGEWSPNRIQARFSADLLR